MNKVIKVLSDLSIECNNKIKNFDMNQEIKDVILIAQKEHELLWLYKEKSDLLVQIASGKYLQDDYMKLLEKIDNLEKELGEMK